MAKPLEVDEVWLGRIMKSLSGLEYGSLHITVHDGRIVQIEKTERSRYESDARARSLAHQDQHSSKSN